MTPYERILAAVELNPERPRVTIRRDDARQLLADNQRLAADVEHYKTGAVRLECICSNHLNMLERRTQERDAAIADLEQHRADTRPLIHPLSLLPHAWAVYVACTIGGMLVGRG